MSEEAVLDAVVAEPVAAEPIAAPVETTPTDPMDAIRDAVGKSVSEFTHPAEKVAAEPAKTPEQVAAEQKVEAETKSATEQKPAEQKVETPKTEVEPNPFDKGGPLPVETLAKAISENPTLQAELDKAGIDTDLLYETSRRAALTDQFAEIFPTPEAAKFASESAQHFYDIEEGFPKIASVQDFDAFVTNTLLPLSVLYGQDGNPLMNPDGRTYQTDGTIEKFFSHANQMETMLRSAQLDGLLKAAANDQSEEGEQLRDELQGLKDAAIKLQEFADNGYKFGPKKESTYQRSPEDQALIDKANKDTQDAAARNTEAAQKEEAAYVEGVLTETASVTNSFVQNTLNATSLTDTEKRLIAKEALEETWGFLKSNRHFQGEKSRLYAQGNTPEVKKAILGVTKVAFETKAANVLRRMIAEAGGKQIAKGQARQEKQESQLANDKMNQGTGTTPGVKTGATMTVNQAKTKFIEQYKATHDGATPEPGEILAGYLAMLKQPA